MSYRSYAIFAGDDLLNLGSTGDTKENDVGITGHVRITLDFYSSSRQQVCKRGSVTPGPHGQRESFGDEVFCDAMAHQAYAYETDSRLFHELIFFPLVHASHRFPFMQDIAKQSASGPEAQVSEQGRSLAQQGGLSKEIISGEG
jgi:hypothetical protein